MPLKKPSPALLLQCLAVLLCAQAASAETLPLVVRIYPEYRGPSLPSNTVIVAHARRGYQLDPGQVSLRNGLDEELPSTITPEADARGGVRVEPLAPLAEGVYMLRTGFETHEVFVSGGADTTPPSAIVEPTVSEEPSSDDSLGDVSIVFPAATDDLTPQGELGYDVWVSPSPAEPDLDSKPTLMGTRGTLIDEGRMRVSLAPGQLCVAALPSKSSGRFIARLRARDAAGNLGPASVPLPLEVEKVPECPNEREEGKGCSAAPLLSPAAWVAVALWLRRRR
jgi:hypothetical protein